MIENLEDRLRAMQEPFDKAPVEGGRSSELPPDGTYQAVVRRFDFIESKSDGKLLLLTELEIAFDREYAGAEAATFHNLEDEERIGWLKKHLSILGANVEEIDLAALQSQVLPSLLDVPVEIAIKTSDKTGTDGTPYRNVYVNKRLGDPLRGPQSDVPADTEGLPQGQEQKSADEKIPF